MSGAFQQFDSVTVDTAVDCKYNPNQGTVLKCE